MLLAHLRPVLHRGSPLSAQPHKRFFHLEDLVCDAEVKPTIPPLPASTPPGFSRPECSAQPAAQRPRVVLIVAEDAVGIPAAERHRACERWVRLDDARTHRADGAGLSDVGGT